MEVSGVVLTYTPGHRVRVKAPTAMHHCGVNYMNTCIHACVRIKGRTACVRSPVNSPWCASLAYFLARGSVRFDAGCVREG